MNKITILYIDDEPINLMLFSSIFNKEYNVITGISGPEGLEKLTENPEIKVVFSDMKMPEMNGVEFITKAKKKYPHVTYFIITGYNITKEISMALKNNIIKKHFIKPFNIEEINKVLSKL